MIGPINKLASHPKGCRCPDHQREAELGKEGWKISRRMITEFRAGNYTETENSHDRLEAIQCERDQLQYG